VTLTPTLRAFLDEQIIGLLATSSADGPIHQSAVYYVREGDELLISTVAGRHKERDVSHTGWASLCVLGHERPFPSATLAGPASIRTESIGPATAAVVQRMMGLDEPPEPQTDEALAQVGRVIIAIDVERVGPVSYLE
jgi:PPOX class probable F420-dependent enzyme